MKMQATRNKKIMILNNRMLVDWTKLNKTRIKIVILNRMSTLPLPYQFPEIVKFESSLTHQYQITACLSGTFSDFKTYQYEAKWRHRSTAECNQVHGRMTYL